MSPLSNGRVLGIVVCSLYRLDRSEILIIDMLQPRASGTALNINDVPLP